MEEKERRKNKQKRELGTVPEWHLACRWPTCWPCDLLHPWQALWTTSCQFWDNWHSMYVPQTPLWNHRPSQGEDITTIISFHLPTYCYLPKNITPHSTTIPQNPKTYKNRLQQRIHERNHRARAHTHNVHNKNAASSLMLLLHIHVFSFTILQLQTAITWTTKRIRSL